MVRGKIYRGTAKKRIVSSPPVCIIQKALLKAEQVRSSVNKDVISDGGHRKNERNEGIEDRI